MKAIFTIGLLIICGSLAAQHTYSIGLKAGINVFKADPGFYLDSRRRIGSMGGLFVQRKLDSLFSLQSEMLYSSEGLKVGVVSGKKSTWRISYISVPLLGQYRPFSGFYIGMGPQVAVPITAKVIEENRGVNTEIVHIRGYIRKLSFYCVFGSEYIKNHIGIGLRYSVSLSGLYKYDSEYRLHGLTISTLYRL